MKPTSSYVIQVLLHILAFLMSGLSSLVFYQLPSKSTRTQTHFHLFLCLSVSNGVWLGSQWWDDRSTEINLSQAYETLTERATKNQALKAMEIILLMISSAKQEF